jgi:hypothetical protein
MCSIAKITELLNEGGGKRMYLYTLLDGFIDRAKGTAGNFLFDQTLVFGIVLTGREKASTSSRMV